MSNGLLRFFVERCSLDTIHGQRYANLFADHFITELELPDLSHELLKEIGVSAIGHRMRILKFAKLYQIENSNVYKNLLEKKFQIPDTDTKPIIETKINNSPELNKNNTPLINQNETNNLDQNNEINMNDNIMQTNEIQENIDQNKEIKSKDIEENSLSITNDTLNNKETEVIDLIDTEFESDNEEDIENEEILINPRCKKSTDFEGVVLLNNLISSRSTSSVPKSFSTPLAHPQFKDRLRKYLSNSFMICQVPPRTHQLKCLELLITDILEKKSKNQINLVSNRTPVNYLLQHSIGSGKSLIIAALVYLLASIKSLKNNLFDIIIVMNDRIQLDMQLWITVSRFLSTHGIFVDSQSRPKTSEMLKDLLLNNNYKDSNEPTIIFSTLQKFIRISNLDKTAISNRIAIIADEAHRSHGGRSTRLLHDFMTGSTRQTMDITYFSFTSTPTPKSLQVFGKKNSSNVIEPFHCYSISEAIRDGHICNPLDNYITVSTKATIDSLDTDNTLYKSNITRSLLHITRAASSSIELLLSRAKFIVNHYVKEIYHKKATTYFNPKAMLVANSRLSVIRYKDIIEEIVTNLPDNDKFEVVVAFTPFQHNGKVYYEEDVNSNYGINYLKEFQREKSKVQMLIVHSKFLIGFDEPLLHTMYIDRGLHGTSLVQALGRLCRATPGKKDTCVVDFVNPRKKVADVFGLYWNKTTMKTFSCFKSDKEKFKRIEEELKNFDCIRNNLPSSECFNYLKRESSFNTKTLSRVMYLIVQYTTLCDKLQVESPDLNLKLLKSLKPFITEQTKGISKEFLNHCKTAMKVTVSDISTTTTGSIKPATTKPLRERKSHSKDVQHSNDLVSVPQLLNSVSTNFKSNQIKLKNSELYNENTIEPPQGISPEMLDFAKGLLRKSHDNDNNNDDNNNNNITGDESPEIYGSIDITRHLKSKAEESKLNTNNNNIRDNNIVSPLQLPPAQLNPSYNTDKRVMVPRIVELTKAFTSLQSTHEDEAKAGLEILKKHVQLGDNKPELQTLDLIPKILTYIKGLYIQNMEHLLSPAIEILTVFCDCMRDIEQLIEYGVLQQLNRLIRSDSVSLAIKSSKLLIKLMDIGKDYFTPTVVNTEIIPSLKNHINNKNADISEIQEFIKVITKLGEDTMCLQQIQIVGLINTFTEITKIEASTTSKMASESLQQFAQSNHSIRNYLRNNKHLRTELIDISNMSSLEKRKSINKLINYIWGPNRGNKGANTEGNKITGTKRQRKPSRKSKEPPRKIKSTQVKSHHSISYHSESNRLKKPNSDYSNKYKEY